MVSSPVLRILLDNHTRNEHVSCQPDLPLLASLCWSSQDCLSVCLTDCRNLICTSKNVTFPTALISSSSCYCTLFCLFIVCLLPSVFLYFHSPYQVWFDSTFFVKQNYSSWTHHTYHSHPVHRLAVSNPLCALRTRESKWWLNGYIRNWRKLVTQDFQDIWFIIFSRLAQRLLSPVSSSGLVSSACGLLICRSSS